MKELVDPPTMFATTSETPHSIDSAYQKDLQWLWQAVELEGLLLEILQGHL